MYLFGVVIFVDNVLVAYAGVTTQTAYIGATGQ